MEKFAFARKAPWFLAAAMASAFGFGVSAAKSAELLPHRAVYDMKLAEVSSGTAIENATGRLVFELTGSACDGFIMNTRLVLDTQIGANSTVLNDFQSSTWENVVDQEFRFLSKDFVNRELNEEIDGTADRSSGTISVSLTSPEERTVDVDGRALFPVQHIFKLIETAKNGDTIFQSYLYDGTDGGDKVYNTTAIIGSRIDDLSSLSEAAPVDAELEDVPAWPITMSYFDETSEDALAGLPIYEISFRIFENAITRDLILDYGEFKLEGQMTDIEIYERADCQLDQ
ncbi:MAG: cell envelope integrity EipB family protein [Pseudomonadota bacterium]